MRRSAPAGKLAWKLTGRVGARRLGRCRHNDFALGAGFAVDNRDRHGTRRFCRSRWRQGCCCRGRGGLGRGGGLRHRDDLRRFFGDPQIGRHYRHRLTARAVFGGHRPQHKRTEEQAKRHRDDLRRRNLYRLPNRLGPCPSGAVRSFIVMRDFVPASSKSATPRNVQYANHDSEHITAFPQRVVPLAGACRKQQKTGAAHRPPRSLASFGAI